MKTVVFCLVAMATSVCGFYSSSDDVVELTPSNFNKLVIQGDEVWMVEFYAPWCGHCQSLAPDWKKAATALKGVVKVGAVNADEHKSLGGQYGIQGFPTIKVFGDNKQKPTDYQGPRSAAGIVNQALDTAKSVVNAKLGGKKSSGGGGGGGGSKQADPDAVVELTDSNFEKEVLQSEDIWLVEFFAPWCGHCKNLAPHWAQAATELKGKVKLGAVDATVHTVTASRYGIRGYPTIKYFPGGKKDREGEEYDGGRTASDIVSWALDKHAQNVPPPEVYQITSAQVLSDNCDERQLCIIAVLPHILDCQSKCRNDYIKLLYQMGEKYKSKRWGWLWSEGAAQLKLEEGLGIGGFGYPAVAAINSRKMKYALMRGAFNEKGLNEFLRDLSYGRGSTAPIKDEKLPEIVTIESWDGKDGELFVEEDIDLSDVELDDLDSSKDEL